MPNLNYNFLECAKKMPPLRHKKNEPFDITASEVAMWLMQQPTIMQKIFNKANEHKLIKYNPESNTWQGVDYEK